MKGYIGPRISLVLLGCAVGFALGAGRARADFTFGTPKNLGPNVNSTVEDGGPCVSKDGLSLYLYSFLDGFGVSTVRMAMRESVEEPWQQAVSVGPSPISAGTALCLSADELSIFYDSFQPGGFGQADIWVATRESLSHPWSPSVNLGPKVNSWSTDMGASISADGLELYFGSDRPGGSGDWDVWVTTRETVSDPWGEAVNLGPAINSPVYDGHPCISPDGLMLFISSDRSGGYGDWDIWVAKRATKNDAWGRPVNLGPPLNTSAGEAEPYLSADGRTLYFSDWWIPRPGGIGRNDLWQAPILPVVDFNGDGQVNGRDVVIMTQCWGQDDPVCDIGPTPFGDGIVDEKDLFALAEYLEEAVVDPTLVAHWAMDETEGITAHDGAGGNDGTIMGLPLWQPAAGAIDGALELNGMAFLTADSVLSPAGGPFSVVAWVNGGAPGQVIVSQGGGANWLMADAAEGTLTTELTKPGRAGGPLLSQAVITDGNWHRVAVTWDGENRKLYVDGVLAAEDTQDSLADCTGRLIIGAANNLVPGTFFTGLIDDVRIYRRAVKP